MHLEYKKVQYSIMYNATRFIFETALAHESGDPGVLCDDGKSRETVPLTAHTQHEHFYVILRKFSCYSKLHLASFFCLNNVRRNTFGTRMPQCSPIPSLYLKAQRREIVVQEA
jgi:hypothetical protein